MTSSDRMATRMPGLSRMSSVLSSSSRSTRRAQRARLRPRLANSRAMPRPRPELAPVMRMFCRMGIEGEGLTLMHVADQQREGADQHFLGRRASLVRDAGAVDRETVVAEDEEQGMRRQSERVAGDRLGGSLGRLRQ